MSNQPSPTSPPESAPSGSPPQPSEPNQLSPPNESGLPEPELYDLLLDGETFKQQQHYLQSIRETITDPYGQQQLDGLLALLRSIAEQAYDKYGIDAIVGNPAIILADYIVRQGVPPERFAQAIQGVTAIQTARLTSPQSIATWLVSTLGSADARALLDQPAPAPAVVPEPTPTETPESP
jgi:hypothetical protein